MTAEPRSAIRPIVLGLVAAGGAAGASLRWAIVVATGSDGTFPWWTLLVNVVGCLLLGLSLRSGPTMRLAAGTGFCGGLTTFSTFSVEVATLLDAGDTTVASVYLVASVVFGVLAFVLGRRMSDA